MLDFGCASKPYKDVFSERYPTYIGADLAGNKSAEVVVNDDGRAPLTRDLPPGGILDLPLTVNAPSQSGEYQLEIDMVQEGVSWFGLKGSKTLQLPITIR